MKRKASILIVEDEPIVVEDIRRSLIKLGYSVCATTSSGVEAVKLARKHLPDLILLDIVLRGEINGIETAERIRSGLSIPVIYLTAYADSATLEKVKVTEPFGYILKPFNDRELYSIIEIALYKHSMDLKLRENENRFRGLFETMAQGVLYYDMGLKMISANPTAERIMGKTHEDLTRSSYTDIWSGAIKENSQPFSETEHPVYMAFSKKKNVSNVVMGIKSPGEKVKWLLVNATPVLAYQASNPHMVFTTFADITRRKEMEIALQKRNVQLIILNSVARAVGKSLNIGQILRASLKEIVRLEEISGGVIFLVEEETAKLSYQVSYRLDKNIVPKLMECFLNTDEGLSKILAMGRPERYSMDEICPGVCASQGTKKTVKERAFIVVPLVEGKMLLGVMVLQENGEHIEKSVEIYSSIGQFISLAIWNAALYEETQQALDQLKIAQIKLVESEKLVGLGSLARNIVHEIGNPLAAINNSIQVLQDRVPLEGRMKELMDIIGWETQRLTRSINTLREFSRPRQFRFGMHDLQEVVKKAILVINQDFELVWARKVIIRFPDSFPQVKMDPDAIEQVAINLIKNALQATHEGGAVTVKLKTVKRKTGEAACLEVSDNGKGIPHDLAEHIFEPHFSTKMGMGLGMHIVKQIVDTHEGTIHLKSTEGKGTVIKVHLPLFEEHQGQSSGH